MTLRVRLTTMISAALVCSGVALAQAPGGPPKPGPEHQKLARFVGKWSGSGDLKPGPFGPGGKMTWTESCEWFPGGFHVLCKNSGSGPLGQSEGMSLLGYDAASKMYTYYGVDSMGQGDYAKGTIQGKTWTYTSETMFEGKTYRSRFILDEVSDKTHNFKWEISEDGKTWNMVMEGQASK